MLPNQAHVRSAQETRCEITLPGIYTQSNADAGLHEAGRMMVSYLRNFLASLCRLSSNLASRIFKPLRKGSNFFFQDAVFSAHHLLFRSRKPILYAISWIWLAAKNAGRLVVYPICGPRNNEMRAECQNAPSAEWTALCRLSETLCTIALQQESRACARNCAQCAEKPAVFHCCGKSEPACPPCPN